MNNVVLIGRLTKDVEPKVTQSGLSVASFNVAINRVNKEGADFPRCKAFGKIAENMQRYCGQGSLVCVEGRLETGSYTGQDGKTVYTTEVIANRVEFLDRKGERDNAEDRGY